MANYYFTIPDSVTLPTDGNKVSLTTDCELHRDDSALPNALTVAADSYNVFLADTPGTGTATAPDVTAPTLSSPTGAKSGETGATSLGVSTNEGNGTLYWGIYPTASTPSAADVVAGTGATVNGSQAVSGTGVQSVSDQTGLTAATAYKAHYVQDDASSNRSSVATSSEFTTDSASGALWDDQFLASQTAPLPSYSIGDRLTADTSGAYVRSGGFQYVKIYDIGGTRAVQLDDTQDQNELCLYNVGAVSDNRIVTFVIEQMPTFSSATELYCAYTDSDNRINTTVQPDGNWSAQVRIGGTNRVNAFITASDFYAGAELTIENDTSTDTVSFKVDGVHVAGSPFSIPVSTAGLGNPGFLLFGKPAQTNLAISRFKIEET